MRKFAILQYWLIAFSLLVFTSAVLADTGASAPAAMPPQVLWGLAAAVIAQAITFGLKRASSWWFFHTAGGAVLLAFLSGAVGCVGPVIMN